jgi:TPR repeat protein/serine/threonine protein kinase
MEIACPECGKPTPRPADILAIKTDCVHCGRSIALDALPTMAPARSNSPVSHKSLEGQRLGGYRLVRLIGRGGMGEVYEAVQESLNRKVAVKVLPQRLAADEAFIKRFNRESGALAQLSHPNIVAIHDRGHEGEHYYFVLELVPGKDGGPADTLHRRLRSETPLAITECARLIQQIVGALAYAHGQGVIHRDIKPSNVLLDARDNARLVDFGLARLAESLGAEDFNLTMTGEVLGTAGYVAPEQREGNKQVDARVDIYSCAVLLYEMLTGRMPEGAFELPSELVEGLDPAWDAVVEKALQRNPDRRYQTAGEFLEAIRAVAAGQSTVRPVERPPREAAQPTRRSDTTSSRLTPIVGKCVKCQTVNPGDNRYCTECGANLYEACPACKAENRVGTKYCGKCGVDLLKLKRIAERRREVADLLSQTERLSKSEAKALLTKANKVLSRLLADSPADEEGKRLKTELDARCRDLVLGEADELLAQARKQSGSLSLLTRAYATLTEALGEFPHDEQIKARLTGVKSELRKAFLDRASAANGSEAMSLLRQMIQLLPEETEAAVRLDRLRTEVAGIKIRAQKLLKDGNFTTVADELTGARKKFPEDKDLADLSRKAFLDRISAANGSEAITLLRQMVQSLPDDTEAVARLDRLRTEVAGIKSRAHKLLKDGHFTAATEELAVGCKKFPNDKDLAALRIAAREGQKGLEKSIEGEISFLWDQRQLVRMLEKLNELSALRADVRGFEGDTLGPARDLRPRLRLGADVRGFEEAKQQAAVGLLEAQQICEKGDAHLAAAETQKSSACYERATAICADCEEAVIGKQKVRLALEAAVRKRRNIKIACAVAAMLPVSLILIIAPISVMKRVDYSKLMAKALAAEQRNDWETAKAAYDKALQIKPGDPKAQQQKEAIITKFTSQLLARGNAVGQTTDVEAVEWYRKAAELNDAGAQYALGLCYYKGQGVATNYEEAVKWYRKAAEQNDAQAQRDLGRCYCSGQGVATNYVEAVKWYRKAAEQNHAEAQWVLGNRYARGEGVAKDEVEAVKWYRKAADQNLAEAQMILGERYANGRGVATNYVEAVKWYRKAAEQNDADAQFTLGNCYYDGQGVAANYVEAVKWYRKAAEQNLAQAQHTLGLCYSGGIGVTRDEVEAAKWNRKAADQNYSADDGVAANDVETVKWLRKAAEQNDAKAQYNLGFCYAKGEGVAKDEAEAVKWYRKAAEQNYAAAQVILGGCYFTGQGVATNYAEAAKWYRKAGEQDFAEAQFVLGCFYSEGKGVVKDEVEAAKWWRKAAEQNYAAAQFGLGACYARGQGVARDAVDTYKWMSLAAAQGNEDAKKYIPKLEAAITKEQIAEGKRRANDWLAQRRDSK